jgi:serine phosphatase RsbU (regulator of sigma subunit)
MTTMPHNIWKVMDKKDLRQFAKAVFFLFATIGPLTLLMDANLIPGSWQMLGLMTLLCGGFSWSIVMLFDRPLYLMMVILLFVLSVFSISLFQPEFLAPNVPDVKASAEVPLVLSNAQLSDIAIKRTAFGMLAIMLISVGYALFVSTLGRETQRFITVQTEMKLAQDIHESLLPKQGTTQPWCDASGVSVPAAQIGGDFYDLLPAGDDRILAVIADASGHGTGAGILSAMTKSGIIQELQHTDDPAVLLGRVNQTIYRVTKKSMFVTCAAVLFDRASMTATIVTAGHPPVLRYDPVSGRTDLYRNQNLALGIAASPQFTSTVVPIRSGELFCLVTDGVSETTNAAEEQFGMERISAELRTVLGRPATEGAGMLVAAVTDHAEGKPLQDDVTALLVRIL